MLRYRTKLENINHIDSILVANSTYQITNNLKKRLFDEKVLVFVKQQENHTIYLLLPVTLLQCKF